MKDARPDAAAAAHRIGEGVRDLARSAVGAAGDLAGDVADGYRKSTRYFKLRAAVIGTWAVLSIATMWGACPPSGSTSNSLGAVANLLPRDASLLGAQVMVRNDGTDIWKDVVLTLDGSWRHERRTIRPGERPVIPVSQFTKDGAPPPPTLEPRLMTIECSEGKVTLPLVVRR